MPGLIHISHIPGLITWNSKSYLHARPFLPACLCQLTAEGWRSPGTQSTFNDFGHDDRTINIVVVIIIIIIIMSAFACLKSVLC